MTIFFVTSEQELQQPAEAVINLLTENPVVAFTGEMAAGKTTFIKEICRQLKVKDTVSSPTFSIVNEYYSEELNKPVYHFDFYRIEDEEEALNIGLEEYLYSGDICLIEWPQKIENLLPLKYVKVRINKEINNQTTRKITIERV